MRQKKSNNNNKKPQKTKANQPTKQTNKQTTKLGTLVYIQLVYFGKMKMF